MRGVLLPVPLATESHISRIATNFLLPRLVRRHHFSQISRNRLEQEPQLLVWSTFHPANKLTTAGEKIQI